MNQIKKIVVPEEIPLRENAETTGSSRDQGRYKMLINKDTGSGDLTLGIGWMKPGEIHLLHHHPVTSEFYYILEGAGTVFVGDEVAKVQPGTAIYIPAGDSHKIVNDGEKELVVIFGYSNTEWKNIWDE